MINQKQFAKSALASEKEVFVVHITYLKSKMLIYLACKAQITLLLAKKVSVFKEYADFLDIFSKKSIIMLSDYFNINKHTIDLKTGK